MESSSERQPQQVAMERTTGPTSRRVLDPVDRVSEVLFGLIMVLTFTGSLSAAESGRAEVRAMLLGALGCNLAWALIDGIMYLMGCLAERGQAIATVRAVRAAADPDEGCRIVTGAVPPAVAAALSPAEIEKVRSYIGRMPEPPARARLHAQDWLGALGVFMLVVLSTIPVLLPFVFVGDAFSALRISNLVAVVMMFVTGYAYGRLSGYWPWLTGLSMVVLGAALVGLTIVLGG
jgi:hypothetical protein